MYIMNLLPGVLQIVHVYIVFAHMVAFDFSQMSGFVVFTFQVLSRNSFHHDHVNYGLGAHCDESLIRGPHAAQPWENCSRASPAVAANTNHTAR